MTLFFSLLKRSHSVGFIVFRSKGGKKWTIYVLYRKHCYFRISVAKAEHRNNYYTLNFFCSSNHIQFSFLLTQASRSYHREKKTRHQLHAKRFCWIINWTALCESSWVVFIFFSSDPPFYVWFLLLLFCGDRFLPFSHECQNTVWCSRALSKLNFQAKVLTLSQITV